MLVASSQYVYDNAGRLTSLRHEQGQTVFAEYVWTFDDLDRITSFTSPDGTSTYTYDSTGQLTGAEHTYQADEQYQYDANGNRIMGGYVVGPNNQILSDGTYDYQYDAEGNRTKRTEIASGDYVEYEWDHRNRLIRVTFKDDQHQTTKTVEYDYDVFHRRIARRVDDDGDGIFDRAERFVYDGLDIVLVFDETGSLKTRYLHGPGIDQMLAAEDAQSEVLWTLADYQGTIVDLLLHDMISGESSVANHRTYDAFGNITSETDPSHEFLYAYTGREWDADAELYYYRARWYDPRLGRFISEDPIGFAAGDPNLVRYVGNSPLNYVDPFGLQSMDPTLPNGMDHTWYVWMQTWNPGIRVPEMAVAGADAGLYAGNTDKTGFIHVYSTPPFWKFWADEEWVATVSYDRWNPEDHAIAIETARKLQQGVDIAKLKEEVAGGMEATVIAVRLVNQPADMLISTGEFIAEPGWLTAAGIILPVAIARPGRLMAKADDVGDGVARAGRYADNVVPHPGHWDEVARAPKPWVEVQSQFSGKPIKYRNGKAYIEEYKIDNVYFDRFQDGVLGEVKADYSWLPRVAPYTDNIAAVDDLLDEARRQVDIAKKYNLPLEWHVEKQYYDFFNDLLKRYGDDLKLVAY